MSLEKPNNKTEAEIAAIAKDRALEKARLLKGGAEHVVDDEENTYLKPTTEQIEQYRQEMEKVLKDPYEDAFSSEATMQQVEKNKKNIKELAKIFTSELNQIFEEDYTPFNTPRRKLENMCSFLANRLGYIEVGEELPYKVIKVESQRRKNALSGEDEDDYDNEYDQWVNVLDIPIVSYKTDYAEAWGLNEDDEEMIENLEMTLQKFIREMPKISKKQRKEKKKIESELKQRETAEYEKRLQY